MNLRISALTVVAGVAAAVMALVPSATAAAFLSLTLDERLERAVDLFVGEVVRVESERRGDDPWTLVTFRVEHWFVYAGDVAAQGDDELTLAFLGGSAPGAGARAVALFPTFAAGERYLVASYGAEASGAASPLVGVTQGLWRERDEVWRDPDGDALALDTSGALILAEDGAARAQWQTALEDRLRVLRGEP